MNLKAIINSLLLIVLVIVFLLVFATNLHNALAYNENHLHVNSC